MSETERPTSATIGGRHLSRYHVQCVDPTRRPKKLARIPRPSTVSVLTIGPLNSPHSYPAIPSIASHASYSLYARTSKPDNSLPPLFEGFTPLPYPAAPPAPPTSQSSPRGLPDVKNKGKSKKKRSPRLYEDGMINLQPLALLASKQPRGHEVTRTALATLQTGHPGQGKRHELNGALAFDPFSPVVPFSQSSGGHSGAKWANIAQAWTPLQQKTEEEEPASMEGVHDKTHQTSPSEMTVLSSSASSAFIPARNHSDDLVTGFDSDSDPRTSARSPRRAGDVSFLARLLDSEEPGGEEREDESNQLPTSCMKKRWLEDVVDSQCHSSDSSTARHKTVRFQRTYPRSTSPPSPDGCHVASLSGGEDDGEEQIQPHITATASVSLSLRITARSSRSSTQREPRAPTDSASNDSTVEEASLLSEPFPDAAASPRPPTPETCVISEDKLDTDSSTSPRLEANGERFSGTDNSAAQEADTLTSTHSPQSDACLSPTEPDQLHAMVSSFHGNDERDDRPEPRLLSPVPEECPLLGRSVDSPRPCGPAGPGHRPHAHNENQAERVISTVSANPSSPTALSTRQRGERGGAGWVTTEPRSHSIPFKDQSSQTATDDSFHPQTDLNDTAAFVSPRPGPCIPVEMDEPPAKGGNANKRGTGDNRKDRTDKGDDWDNRMRVWLTQTAWRQEITMD